MIHSIPIFQFHFSEPYWWKWEQANEGKRQNNGVKLDKILNSFESLWGREMENGRLISLACYGRGKPSNDINSLTTKQNFIFPFRYVPWFFFKSGVYLSIMSRDHCSWFLCSCLSRSFYSFFNFEATLLALTACYESYNFIISLAVKDNMKLRIIIDRWLKLLARRRKHEEIFHIFPIAINHRP